MTQQLLYTASVQQYSISDDDRVEMLESMGGGTVHHN